MNLKAKADEDTNLGFNILTMEHLKALNLSQELKHKYPKSFASNLRTFRCPSPPQKGIPRLNNTKQHSLKKPNWAATGGLLRGRSKQEGGREWMWTLLPSYNEVGNRKTTAAHRGIMASRFECLNTRCGELPPLLCFQNPFSE